MNYFTIRNNYTYNSFMRQLIAVNYFQSNDLLICTFDPANIVSKTKDSSDPTDSDRSSVDCKAGKICYVNKRDSIISFGFLMNISYISTTD